MEEIWKDIENYEGLYQVSNLGRVKSLPRKRITPTGWPYLSKEKILTPKLRKDGYLEISLYTKGKSKSYFIHRLVAQAFIPNTESKPQVNHIDGDKTNNQVNNLEWATREENMQHAFKTGLIDSSKISEARTGKYSGKNHPLYGKHHTQESKKKMSEAKKGMYVGDKSSSARSIICITTGEIFTCIKYASSQYSIKDSNISLCCKGKRNYCGKLPDGTKLKWMYYEDYLKLTEKEE